VRFINRVLKKIGNDDLDKRKQVKQLVAFSHVKKFHERYIAFHLICKIAGCTFVAFRKKFNFTYMKIIIVGATGTIGRSVTAELSKRHEVIKASRTNADIKVDILSPTSIEEMYNEVGAFDAVVSTTGAAYFGSLKPATDLDFRKGIDSKLMGQVNLVLIGQHYINPKGSFTLTTGVLAEDPVINGSNLSMVNGGIHSFVIAAAIELENNIRINAVCPGVVEDAPHYFPYFPGHIPVPMDRVVAGYIKSVEGANTGKIIKIL
jgi:hypothetical protein